MGRACPAKTELPRARPRALATCAQHEDYEAVRNMFTRNRLSEKLSDADLGLRRVANRRRAKASPLRRGGALLANGQENPRLDPIATGSSNHDQHHYECQQRQPAPDPFPLLPPGFPVECLDGRRASPR
jgi:hypothetical protein